MVPVCLQQKERGGYELVKDDPERSGSKSQSVPKSLNPYHRIYPRLLGGGHITIYFIQ